MIDAKLAGANAKLLEEVAEPPGLPAPNVVLNGPNNVDLAHPSNVQSRRK
jgi:hypothetical protein